MSLIRTTTAILILFSMSAVSNLAADQAPPEKKRAQLIVVKPFAVELARTADIYSDSPFSTLIEKLEKTSVGDEELFQAVYLILKAAGLAFNFTVWLPPDMNYQEFMYNSSYWLIGDSKGELSGEVKEAVLGAYDRNAGTKPLLSSYGLVLASTLSPQDAEDRVTALISSEHVRKGPEAALVLHNACISAIIVTRLSHDDRKLSQSLAALLPLLEGEEEREDVIVALSRMTDESANVAVSKFIFGPAKQHSDLDYETALLAFKSRMKPEAFSRFVDELLQKEKDKKNTKMLRAFKERNFTYGLTSASGALKGLGWVCRVNVRNTR